MSNQTGIHCGSPETSLRCRAIYHFLLVRGYVGATSIELSEAEGRRQVAAATTVSEIRNWARKAQRPDMEFPCRYQGLVDGCKVFRFWISLAAQSEHDRINGIEQPTAPAANSSQLLPVPA
jgi:hypothetical protein